MLGTLSKRFITYLIHCHRGQNSNCCFTPLPTVKSNRGNQRTYDNIRTVALLCNRCSNVEDSHASSNLIKMTGIFKCCGRQHEIFWRSFGRFQPWWPHAGTMMNILWSIIHYQKLVVSTLSLRQSEKKNLDIRDTDWDSTTTFAQSNTTRKSSSENFWWSIIAHLKVFL